MKMLTETEVRALLEEAYKAGYSDLYEAALDIVTPGLLASPAVMVPCKVYVDKVMEKL
jgi:hypothetical protein